MKWECINCNMPVSQPCCRIETAKLKEDTLPVPVATNTCILIDTVSADWKSAPDTFVENSNSAAGEAGIAYILKELPIMQKQVNVGHSVFIAGAVHFAKKVLATAGVS